MTEDDAGALQARTRCVTLVLEALYAERERARLGDHEVWVPSQGDDVLYENLHVTVGDWLTEAMSSGAIALAHREKIAKRPGQPADRVEQAQHTRITALSMIAALEALARQTDEPKLADRQWVVRRTAGEAVECWHPISKELVGLERGVTFWLPIALLAYVGPLEKGTEVEPMPVAKFLIRALAWTAGELAVSEESALSSGQ